MSAQARARNTDADSSHAAAAQVELSGLAHDHRMLTLELVKRHPGSTSAELSQLSAGMLNRHQTARRLPELVENGQVMNPKDPTLSRGITHKVCDVTGRACLRWWPINKAEQP